MFTTGAFISWTGTDEDGLFKYNGQVQQMDGETVVFSDCNNIKYGVHKEDGTFTSITKPKWWDAKIAEAASKTPVPAPVAVVSPVVEKKTRVTRTTTNGTSKLDQVIALLNEKPELVNSRKNAIAAIVEAGISTAAGASTHFNSAKKQLT